MSFLEQYHHKILSISLEEIRQKAKVDKESGSGFRWFNCPVISKYLLGIPLSFHELESISNSFIIDFSKEGSWFRAHVISPKLSANAHGRD
jgi:hypothetical protein